MRAREDLLNDVRAFESNGELLAGAGVIRARVERPVGLQHGGRREVEISLALPAMIGQVTYQCRAFMDHFPMNAIFSGNDAVRLKIGHCRKRFLEETHDVRVVRITHHGRPNARNEILFGRKVIDGLQQPERIIIGLPANEFSERLSHDANGLCLVSSPREIALDGAQDGQRIGDLPVEGCRVETDESRDRPDGRLRISLRVTGRSEQDQHEGAHKADSTMVHYPPSYRFS